MTATSARLGGEPVAMRQQLYAFWGRDPGKAWAWFVQATRMLTVEDFERLVGRGWRSKL